MVTKRAFTLVETLVVIAIIAGLLGVLMPALSVARARGHMLRDASQMREIHSAWLTFADAANQTFPTPGLIDPLPVSLGGVSRDVPGRGPEDTRNNTTANVHSACIMQNYYTPDLCVGPAEPNANVFVYDRYDFTAYDVARDVYWDRGFRAKLQVEANVSYASIPVGGPRKENEWRASLNSRFAAIANRGPKDGIVVPFDPTYELHGHGRHWVGNVCYNDNHTTVHDTLVPAALPSLEDGTPDNLFRNDSSADQSDPTGTDTWLVVVDGCGGHFRLEWDNDL